METVNKRQKEILAKLLAQEDLTIVHKNVRTAYFDLRNRQIILPVWDNISTALYDLFVGHEVGHALATPEKGWHDAVAVSKVAPKSYLNIIEDCRIEQIVQKKYPGIRKQFIQGYRELIDRGFFGHDPLPIVNMTYPLIDRINIHFKAGPSYGIQFNADEQPWIDEISNLNTWDEVVDFCDRLYKWLKEQKQDQQSQTDNSHSESEMEESDEDFDDSDGEWIESDEDQELNEDQEKKNNQYEKSKETNSEDGEEDINDSSDESNDCSEEESEDSDENSDDFSFSENEDSEDTNKEKDDSNSSSDDNDDENSNTNNDNESNEKEDSNSDHGQNKADDDSDLESKTDQNFRDMMEKEYGENDSVHITDNYTFPKSVAPNRHIVHNRELLKDIKDNNMNAVNEASNSYSQMRRRNIGVVNHLVKEFNMKRSAELRVKTKTSKTGVICPVKMNTYRYNDDIFQRATSIPKGKSHGMIMYIDWSGSMNNQLLNTFEQTLNLLWFCRKVNIPFEVYAFSDSTTANKWCVIDKNAKVEFEDNDIKTASFRLLQLFNSRTMKGNDFDLMAKAMIAVTNNLSRRSYMGRMIDGFKTSGTPLESAILCAPEIDSNFREKNRVEIVSNIFLTDGNGNGAYVCNSSRGLCGHVKPTTSGHYTYITDKVTKKIYKAEDFTDMRFDDILFQRLRDVTGSNVIGMRLIGENSNSYARDAIIESIARPGDNFSDMKLQWNKYKFATSKNSGLDMLFAFEMMQPKIGEIQTYSWDTLKDVGKSFKTARHNTKESRFMLTQFMDIIA